MHLVPLKILKESDHLGMMIVVRSHVSPHEIVVTVVVVASSWRQILGQSVIA